MKAFAYPLAFLNALCVALLCLYVAVNIPTFSMAFYRWQFDVNDTMAVIGIEEEELLRVTSHMLGYIRGQEPDLQIVAIVEGQPRPFFNQREILHMIDVYELFAMGRQLRNGAISLIVATTAILFVMRVRLMAVLARAYRATTMGMLLIAVALAVPFVADFHYAFIIFHEIFFDNELWQLNPETDLLINVVPLSFFITISIFIGVIFSGLMLLVGLLSNAYVRTLPARKVPKLP